MENFEKFRDILVGNLKEAVDEATTFAEDEGDEIDETWVFNMMTLTNEIADSTDILTLNRIVENGDLRDFMTSAILDFFKKD